MNSLDQHEELNANKKLADTEIIERQLLFLAHSSPSTN